MNKPSWPFGYIPKGLEWNRRNRAKAIVLGDFLASFEIANGGKVTQDRKYGKFSYLAFDILNNLDNFVRMKNFHFYAIWKIEILAKRMEIVQNV